MHLNLLVRSGTLVDRTGPPGRAADAGVTGDRVIAVGDITTGTRAGRLVRRP